MVMDVIQSFTSEISFTCKCKPDCSFPLIIDRNAGFLNDYRILIDGFSLASTEPPQ